jgi:hypothetical protein
MKHNSIYILIFLLCVNCRAGRAQDIKYDCRLFEGDFNELEYVNGTSIETSFTDFTQDVGDGVFFINRFLGHSKFYKAILLKKDNEKTVVVDLLKKERQVMLVGEEQKNLGEILGNIEKGSFRQACFNSPSEGSISVLIVKVKGVTVLKYEAGQHDYSHLNEDEKVKIKNALELIKLLINTVN